MDTAVLQTFLHIVEEGSFVAAARRMGISRSLASKNIADLEARLGAQLLTRTTRAVRLTEIGTEYYEQVKAALSTLKAAEDSVRSATGSVAGRLRIGAPQSYSRLFLSRFVIDFMEAYPDIQLELVLDDQPSDLLAAGLDAVVRVGELTDSSLIARRIHSVKSIVVASPNYLQAQGTPLHPSDLGAHKALHNSAVSDTFTWPFLIEGERHYVKIQPALVANSSEILHSAAMEGHGLLRVADFMVRDELESGKLVKVLPDFVTGDVPVNLLYPASRNLTGAMRALIDFTRKVRPTEASLVRV